MVARTYRTEVIGQFDRPDGELGERLLATQTDHDVFSSAYTDDGCWTYGPTLTRFTVRHLLTVEAASAVDADEDSGVAWRADLSVSTTCLQDVRARR